MADTLDIKEPQTLLHFPYDDGFYWHHRILVRRAKGSVWILLTPDGDLEVVDLAARRHLVIGRNARFPATQRDFVYGFDDVSAQELRDAKRNAVIQARILEADGGPEEQDAAVWLVYGPSSGTGPTAPGSEVPEDVVEDTDRFVSIGDKGVAEVQGEIVWVQCVERSEVEQWERQLILGADDDRVLPVVIEHDRRFSPLRDCIKKLTEKDYDDWRFTEGPRLCREYLQPIDTAGGFVAFEAEWLRSSGVHSSSAAAHEHRTGSETLRLLVEVDQVNVPNLAGVENLCRRQVQVEIAVERNPTHPDFLGLSEIMSSPTTESGAALTRKFRSWMGQQQKDRAKLLQQARLEREENKSGPREGPERDPRKRQPKGGPKGKDKAAEDPAKAAGKGAPG